MSFTFCDLLIRTFALDLLVDAALQGTLIAASMYAEKVLTTSVT